MKIDSAKILVVEDDTSIRTTLAMLLESEGYRVDVVTNIQEAINYLKSSRKDPCLVLTDLFMPGDGRELVTLMRETDEMLSIPVIIMSASATDNTPRGVPFVKKPFYLVQVMDYVKKFCKQE